MSSRSASLALAMLVLLGACARDDRTPRQLLNEGVAAWKDGRVDEAEQLLRAATERAAAAGTDIHSMREYHGRLFALLAALDRREDAEKAYADGVESTDRIMINRVAAHNLGVIRLRHGDYGGAADILRATRSSLHGSYGGVERLILIMVLMHLDIATIEAGSRESGIGADVLRVFDDLARPNRGVHPALLRELSVYADRLEGARLTAAAVAARERVHQQRARGADPSVPAGSCLTLDLPPPVGCILSLDPES